MATRFYLPSTLAADVSPVYTFQASWDETGSAVRRKMDTSKNGAAAVTQTVAKTATGANTRALVRQYVSRPLAGSQTISGTLKGTILVAESAVNDNIDKVSIKLLLVSNDGSTLRGALFNLGEYGPTNEWVKTTLTARRIADGDTLTDQSVTDGDRIVLEIGYTNTTTGVSISGDMRYGDASGSDLGDNETDTADNNPFIEFSGTITFQAVTHQMTGSLSGGATTADGMKIVNVVNGSLSCGASTADGMKIVEPMTGSLSGGATTSGVAVLAKGGTGSLSGGMTASGAAFLLLPMTGSLEGTGETSGVLAIVVPVTGSLSGSGSTSGVAVIVYPGAGSLSGSGETQGATLLVLPLAGSLSGSVETSGAMDVIEPGSVWSGSLEGGASTSGAAAEISAASGSLEGGAETSGAMLLPWKYYEQTCEALIAGDLDGQDLWTKLFGSGTWYVENDASMGGTKNLNVPSCPSSDSTPYRRMLAMPASHDCEFDITCDMGGSYAMNYVGVYSTDNDGYSNFDWAVQVQQAWGVQYVYCFSNNWGYSVNVLLEGVSNRHILVRRRSGGQSEFYVDGNLIGTLNTSEILGDRMLIDGAYAVSGSRRIDNIVVWNLSSEPVTHWLEAAVSAGAEAGPAAGDRLHMLRLYGIPNAAAVLGMGATWSVQGAASLGAQATCNLEEIASFAGVFPGATATCTLDWTNLSTLRGRTIELERQAEKMWPRVMR